MCACGYTRIYIYIYMYMYTHTCTHELKKYFSLRVHVENVDVRITGQVPERRR